MMKKQNRRSPGTILSCCLFLTLTVTFFSPMEVVLMNAGEFNFPFENVWWFQLGIALAAGLLLSLVLLALPPRAGRIAAAVPLGLGLAAYVQAMFLNGAMVSLTGARMKLTDGERTGNLVIWALILLAVLIGTVLLQRKNRKRTDLVMRGLSLALIAVQSAAMVSQALTGGTPEKKKEADVR